jgi:two-component system chemotaxis response regulator CheB
MAEGKVAIVVIGGSAGSLEALLEILPAIKPGFPLPIVLVLHRKSSGDDTLVDLLAARTHFKVKETEEKDTPKKGTLYIVPPDYHLLFEEDQAFSLDVSEKVNYCRPSIDIVFQSAANVYGSKLVCILLSGANADGTDGFRYVQEKNGITIAQSPDSAEVSYMPEQAISKNTASKIMSNRDLTDYLNSLAVTTENI